MAIFENDSDSVSGQGVIRGLDFWLYDGGSVLELYPDGHNASPAVVSVKNNTGLYEWRHIAATCTGDPSSVKLFLNGREWPLKASSSVAITDSKYLIILDNQAWHNTNPFTGSIACVSVFKIPLSLNKIRAVMNNCP